MIEFGAQHPVLTCGLAILIGAGAAVVRGSFILRRLRREQPELFTGELVGTVSRGPWGAS